MVVQTDGEALSQPAVLAASRARAGYEAGLSSVTTVGGCCYNSEMQLQVLSPQNITVAKKKKKKNK